jgi:mxaJ protein
LITAVSKGDVDVAIAWGPLAGYFARGSKVPLQISRVHPDEEPPFPFVFDMSMGVARSNTALRDELNRVIADNQPAIDAILRDYAVPVIEPTKVASR